MGLRVEGIDRSQKPLDLRPGGVTLKYAAASKGREWLVPHAETGSLFIDSWSFEDLLDMAGAGEEDRTAFARTEDLAVYCGGWQSWSAGWELTDGETLPKKVRIIPELLRQTNPPRDFLNSAGLGRSGDKADRDWLSSHFITYLRSGGHYLCIASREGGGLPPVTCRVNRKDRLIAAEIFCSGKFWREGDPMAELYIFLARGFFPLKDALAAVYQQGIPFRTINFLRTRSGGALPPGKAALPGGYESWYNHYTDIDEGLIMEDLDALGRTDNLIKQWYLDRGRPVVFQIDDGWEKAVGEWEIDDRRFPRGLRPVAENIEAAGCVPGLWIAPFIVTRKARLFREKPHWLLRDGRGGAVAAGFNHLWDKQYYCLDISRADVLEYLKALMNRVIDDWGFRYLKLDFLYTGLFPGAFAEGGSPYEHYDRAAAVLTGRSSSAAGLPVAYLGCGLPLGPSYRRFPLSRIGADTREEWDWNLVKLLGHVGRPGAYVSLLDTIGRSFMDGTVYINDPDVVFLRSRNCKLSENEKELIALVNFLLAGQIMFSDDPLRLTEKDRALTRRIIALYDALAGDEYGAARISRDVFRLESRSGKTAGIINLSNRAFSLDRIGDAGLYDALAGGQFLVDHRLKTGGKTTFDPHSISIATR
jgi:alpha-galactosidase